MGWNSDESEKKKKALVNPFVGVHHRQILKLHAFHRPHFPHVWKYLHQFRGVAVIFL